MTDDFDAAEDKRHAMWIEVEQMRDRIMPGVPNPFRDAGTWRLLLSAMLDLNNRLERLEAERSTK